MTLALLVVFVVSFTLAIVRMVNYAEPIIGWAKGLAASCLRPPPDWVEQVS
jgi:Na+(H+)/acetate symporter ActP